MTGYRQAAREEADRHYPHTGSDADVDSARAARRITFRGGARFEHDRIVSLLAADETVEAVAGAILALSGETEETAHYDDIDVAWDHARAVLAKIREVIA